MKTIGLLGGIGPESTINYYKNIISLYRDITKKDEYPNILINSIDMTKMLNLVANMQFEDLVTYLSCEIDKLILAGAEICAICSNTPHIVFDSLRLKFSIPIVSIVDATSKEAFQRNLKKVLLIGTSFTMKNDFYSKSFKKYNIETCVPDTNDQRVIHNIIFPELEAGIVIPQKKKKLIKTCKKIITNNKLDGIILGCTELPLMINSNDFNIEVLDTVEVHIKEIVHQALDI